MKTTIKLLLLTTVCLITGFEILAQARLEITVKNIKGAKGNIMVGLFTNEADFLKNVSIGKVVKAQGKEITIVFENLKSGDYAISIIHDENENGKLDSNMIGIPKEGFAFGNNAMGTFGPPSFEKASVSLNGKTAKQVIDLKYF